MTRERPYFLVPFLETLQANWTVPGAAIKADVALFDARIALFAMLELGFVSSAAASTRGAMPYLRAIHVKDHTLHALIVCKGGFASFTFGTDT